MSENVKTIKVSISGIDPGLLLHNPRSSNPLDPMAKQLAELGKVYKKNKTEDNLIEYLKCQWHCGLYWEEGKGCFIPRGMVQATLIGAAKGVKQNGKMASMARIISGAISPKGDSPLNIPVAHKTLDEIKKLAEDSNYNFVIPASIGSALVPVSRPRFKDWDATLYFNVFDETAIPMDAFKEIVDIMGTRGFGDWRPSGPTPGEHGMFIADKFEQSVDDGATWQEV